MSGVITHLYAPVLEQAAKGLSHNTPLTHRQLLIQGPYACLHHINCMLHLVLCQELSDRAQVQQGDLQASIDGDAIMFEPVYHNHLPAVHQIVDAAKARDQVQHAEGGTLNGALLCDFNTHVGVADMLCKSCHADQATVLLMCT